MVGDEAGRILDVNRRMCEMLGYTVDELSPCRCRASSTLTT
jgi:PAS domain S-box-containing protein